MKSYPADALFASRTAEPTGGVPSLTDGEITQLYQWWLTKPPDGGELASERENALKYSAAGIERQIALRASNIPASNISGGENLSPLTVPAPIVPAQVGNVITAGAAAIGPGALTAGPTGLVYANSPGYGMPAGPAIGGISITTILIGAAILAGVAFLMLKR